MWRIAFKLFNNDIMKTLLRCTRILGDFSQGRKISLCIILHIRPFAHTRASFFGLHISVWLQFKSYVNVRRLLKIFSCLFSCNTYLTTDRITVITINVHIIFLCYIMIKIHNNYFLTFLLLYFHSWEMPLSILVMSSLIA